MAPWARSAALAAFLVSAGFAGDAARAQAQPSGGSAEQADHEAYETLEAVAEHLERSEAMHAEDSTTAEDALDAAADAAADEAHSAAEEDSEPGFSRTARPSGGGSGPAPSAQFRANFDLIYQLRKRRSDQEVEIFRLRNLLAARTGHPARAEPPGLGLFQVSSAGTVDQQLLEIAELREELTRNGDLVKRLRERVGGGR